MISRMPTLVEGALHEAIKVLLLRADYRINSTIEGEMLEHFVREDLNESEVNNGCN